MNEDTSDIYISWQGSVSGPFSVKDIRSMLKAGKINSLYRVQANGQWILLRDHLAEIDRLNRAAAKELEAQSRVVNYPQAAAIPVPRIIPEDFGQDEQRSITTRAINVPAEVTTSPAKGIAITSFVLSLFFFIPILNGITQLLALIFGHLALSQMGSQNRSNARGLASTALWITYVQLGFLGVSMTWLALTEFPSLSLGYMVLHWQMIGIALTSLIGSGLLMLGIKLLTTHFLSFRVCFIGALLPAAVNNFGMMVIQSLIADQSPSSARAIASIGLLQAFMFVVQMIFWSNYIKLSNNEELGYGRAALASLFYSIVFIFIGILYLILFAMLVNY